MKVTKETRLESYINRPVSRQKEILEALECPMTARQIMNKLHFSDMNAVRPRLTELMEQGLVETAGKAYDPITERTVTVFMRCE